MSSCFSRLESAEPASIARYLPADPGSGARYPKTEVGGAFLTADAFRITPSEPLRLRWNRLPPDALRRASRLRLTLVSNLRTFQSLEVLSSSEGPTLGVFDVSLGTNYQVLDLPLAPEKVRLVAKEGLEIRLTGEGGAVEIFAPGPGTPAEFAPCLMQPGTRRPQDEFLMRLASRASLTPFGWQHACVLDGLACLAARARKGTRFDRALEDHLNLVFPIDGPPRPFPSIENTAMLAQLVQKRPASPQIEATLAFWRSKQKEHGAINDGRTTVAEGNYSVAWPLACMAKALDRPDLAESAIAELRLRKHKLVDSDGAIWLRHHGDSATPVRTYRLWARGNAWYFLRLARTLDALPNAPDDLVAEVKRTADYLLPLQTPDGMWRVFSAEPRTAPESSGTAGVATALAIGVRRGWLGRPEEGAARRALAGLRARLTPDGFLTGVSQSNKKEGGEAYQRYTSGAILQWGMGLLGQLTAELDPPAA